MPMRKPPCKGCQFRRQNCHEKCDGYQAYAKLLQKDKDAEHSYKASRSSWTLARSQSFKRSEKYQQKKSNGVVK